MGIEEPTLAGLLDRLQEGGWIQRRASPNDPAVQNRPISSVARKLSSTKFSNTAHGLRHELIERHSVARLEACIRVLTQIRKKAEEPGPPQKTVGPQTGAEHRIEKYSSDSNNSSQRRRRASVGISNTASVRKRVHIFGGSCRRVLLLRADLVGRQKPAPRQHRGRGGPKVIQKDVPLYPR